MSIKNLFLIICLITVSSNQAIAVYSTTNSISIEEKVTPKRTLKDRLIDAWVTKKIKKLGNNISLPPDLQKCLNINLKNQQVHKGYEVKITGNSVAYKKCNADNDVINEVDLDKIESVTSTDGKEVYFKQPLQKIKTAILSDDAKLHPAVTMSLVLTLAGLGMAMWFNIFFGLTMVISGVMLALVTKKLLKNNDRWKGMSLIRLITVLGAGLLMVIARFANRIK